jgi:hypothetical protein
VDTDHLAQKVLLELSRRVVSTQPYCSTWEMNRCHPRDELDEVAQGHLRHSRQTSPLELTCPWKGNPTPSHNCSHHGILTSRG